LFFRLGWPALPFTPFLFVAFVPLFYIEDDISKQTIPNHLSIWKWPFIAFLIFNISTCYMFSQFSWLGSISIWLLNSFLMSLAFFFFHITKQYFSRRVGYFAFVIYWLALEWLQYHWTFNFPWLNLGNAWGEHPWVVYWYQLTGVGGGTLWILLLNLIFYSLFNQIKNKERKLLKPLLLLTISILLPYGLSYLMSIFYVHEFEHKLTKKHTIAIQPNRQSFKEKELKLYSISKDHQTIFEELDGFINGKTEIIVYPENYKSVNFEPKLNLPSLQKKDEVMSGLTLYQNDKLKGSISRFNTLFYYDEQAHYLVKEKMVPGSEYLPFGNYFGIKRQEDHFDFPNKTGELSYATNDSFPLPAAICYEAVFGELIASRAKGNGYPMYIVSDEVWMQGTELYHQSLNMARLRAIENIKFVVKCTNSGITALIHPNGKIINQLEPNIAAQLTIDPLYWRESELFYQTHGDYIYRLAAWISVLLLGYTLVASLTNNYKFKRLGTR